MQYDHNYLNLKNHVMYADIGGIEYASGIVILQSIE
jgi:hypothetical protein